MYPLMVRNFGGALYVSRHRAATEFACPAFDKNLPRNRRVLAVVRPRFRSHLGMPARGVLEYGEIEMTDGGQLNSTSRGARRGWTVGILFIGTMLWAAADAVARPGAAAAAPGGLVTLDDVGAGTLLFKTRRPGRFVPAPMVATEVDMRVGGMVARVEVRQTFLNPSQSWLEGIYAFPLPDNAAVDGMRIAFGDKVIDAVIAERAAARRTYDKARKEGRKAALIEQHRPNIFTNDVANIGPGEAITVTLRYQQTLRYDQGRFRLRFPMVVGPRYTPGQLTVSSAGKDGWSRTAEIAADAERISSPVLRPEAGKVNPVALRIVLDAGFPLAELHSPYHTIVGSDWRDGTATITLDPGAVPADRDFELVWKPDTGTAPVAGVFQEIVDDKAYVLVMVLPPHRGRPDRENKAVAPMPRDLVFVLDRSGSMAGVSIIQAREATKVALDRLRPADRFEIIRFSSAHDTLFGAVRHATPENLARATSFVAGTTADGCTEMLAPLRRALAGRAVRGRLRQIVFLTDGGVSNESQLLAEIDARLGHARLFTVGIGSAPNGYFMRKAAAAGRGSYTYIGSAHDVSARVGGLFRKLERPVLTDVLTAWTTSAGDGIAMEAYPDLIPDLYDGEPVVVVARLDGDGGGEAELRLNGVFNGREWRHVLRLDNARDTAGVAALWGRAKIAELTDSLRRGADPATVKQAVIETALRHRLVSRHTSLVAVAKTVDRPPETAVSRRKVALNLPHGWDYDRVFGEMLIKSKPPRQRDAGLDPAAPQLAAAMVNLPAGATPAPLHLLIGAIALLLAGALVLWSRREV